MRVWKAKANAAKNAGDRAQQVASAALSGVMSVTSGRHARAVAREIVEAGYPFVELVSKLDSKFRMLREVGRGRTSVVYEAAALDSDEVFALKVFSTAKLAENDSHHLRSLLAEVLIMRQVGYHPNIIQLHGVVCSSEQTALVLDLVTGGDVLEAVETRGAVDEAHARTICAQLVSAMSHMHAHGVAHRDLKLENLCYTDESRATIAVVDFGLAAFTSGGADMTGIAGTAVFSAPEVMSWFWEDMDPDEMKVAGPRPEGCSAEAYSVSCDVWSLGVCLYAMMSAGLPYEHGEDLLMSELLEDMRTAPQLPTEAQPWSQVSPDAVDFVRAALAIDPAERPSVHALAGHDWVADMVVLQDYRAPPPPPVVECSVRCEEGQDGQVARVRVLLSAAALRQPSSTADVFESDGTLPHPVNLAAESERLDLLASFSFLSEAFVGGQQHTSLAPMPDLFAGDVGVSVYWGSAGGPARRPSFLGAVRAIARPGTPTRSGSEHARRCAEERRAVEGRDADLEVTVRVADEGVFVIQGPTADVDGDGRLNLALPSGRAWAWLDGALDEECLAAFADDPQAAMRFARCFALSSTRFQAFCAARGLVPQAPSSAHAPTSQSSTFSPLHRAMPAWRLRGRGASQDEGRRAAGGGLRAKGPFGLGSRTAKASSGQRPEPAPAVDEAGDDRVGIDVTEDVPQQDPLP